MLIEKKSRSFANGVVYVLETEDGYPIEVTDTFLPYYTKDCINEHINQLKDYHLGDRSERWMIGVSVMSGCPVHCAFCLDGNTSIMMSDLTIKKLKDIKIGDKIVGNLLRNKVTLNAQDYATKAFAISTVKNVFNRHYTGKLYNIVLNNGASLTITENHPIATYQGEGKRIKFLTPKELNKGDKLLGLNDFNSYKSIIEEKTDSWLFGWLMGFIYGDGVYCKVTNRSCHFWQISQSFEWIIDFAISICNKNGILHGNKYINRIKEDRQNLYKTNYVFKINQQGLNRIEELLKIYEKDKEYKKGYVAGFWDAEGYSFKNNSTTRFCNTNKKNLEKVLEYLEYLGFSGKIRLYDSDNHEVDRNNGLNNLKDMYILETSINRFCFNLIFKPLHPKKNFFEVENRKYKAGKFYEIDSIKCKNVYNYPVFNIETDRHTYIANNIVVHNCATGQLKKWRNLTADEIVEEVQFILSKHPEYNPKDCKEFKINFTRMGEPFLNIENVKSAVEKIEAMLSDTYVHCFISTIGVRGSDFSWIKGNRTLQVSLHSLDEERRNNLIPFKKKMTIEELGQVRTESDLKTTVNMTLVDTADFDIEKLKKYFDPKYFFIKVSPINPNVISESNNMGKGVITTENLM